MPDILETIGFGSINMLDIMSVITTTVTLLLFVGAIGVVIFFIMRSGKIKVGKYPVKVDIFKIMNGSLKWVEGDSARRVKKKDGEEYYEFKKRNVKWNPPTFQAMVNTTKGNSKLYLKELSHDNFEIINPAAFVTGKEEDYKRIETDHVVKFWNVLEHNKANYKWNKDDKWKKLIDALPIVLSLFGLGLFFYFFGTYILVPTLGQANSGQVLLQQSMELLDKSTTYIDTLLRLNGINPTVPANGTVVIP